MQPLTSYETSFLKRRRNWIIIAGVVALCAIGALLLFFPSRSTGVTLDKPASSRDMEQRPAYRNRALFRRAPGPRAAEQAPAAAPSISGRVFDLDGAGVGAATVVATTFEVAGNLPSVVGSTQSDDNGRFELRLPHGAYEIHASREGYGPNYAPAHTGDEVSVLLSKSGAIEGRVVDERGDPIRDFAIDVLTLAPDDLPAPAPMWSKRFSSPDGSFRVAELPTWPIVVRATGADRAPAFSERVRVRPGDTEKIELTLLNGCAIEGIVVDEQGAPAPGVFLDAESRVVAGSMSEVSMEAAKQGVSDADGRFRIENVPLGEIVVRGYDGASAVSTATLTLDQCDGVAPIRLVMSDGGGIAGVVRRSDGEPAAGVTLTVTQRAIGVVTAQTDAEGRYRFDQIPPSPVRMEVRDGDRIAVLFVEVKQDEVAVQDVTLHAEGTGGLRGRVTAGSTPLPGFRLMVVANRGEEAGMEMLLPITGEDGTYSVPSLAAGTYLVNAITSGAAGGVRIRDGEVATLDLDVAAPRERPRTRQ